MVASNTFTGPVDKSVNTVVSPDRSYVNVGTKITPLIQKLYSIFLWNMDTNGVLEDDALDPSGTRPLAEYFFHTPPKSAEITEPFTTRVIATQNGGKFIESHGSIFKDIRISGTTGLRPRKGSPEQIPLLTIPTASFQNLANTVDSFRNEIKQIPASEVTGFDDIHFLRNIFRRYSDSLVTSERIVMVYRNIKDNDYWVVEPRDFRLSTSSQSPLTYNYSINLQGLAPFAETLPIIEDDPLAKLNDYQRFVSRIAEVKQNITASFLVIATQTSRIQGAGFFKINNTIGTFTEVLRGLNAVFSGALSVADNLARVASQGITECGEAIEALKDTLEPVLDGGGRARDSIINAFRSVERSLRKIITDPVIINNVSNEEATRRRRANSAYRAPGVGPSSPPRTGGDPTFVGNSTSPGRVAEGRVGSGDTIRDLAKKYLGDARRWHELVLLNDLRAPFTSDGEARPGVLVPGDTFLYPSNSAASDPLNINPPNLSPTEQEGSLDNPSSLIAQTYGRDLRLRSVQSVGDLDFTDIAVNQRGDFATIVGVPNVQQAVRVKFLTEQGELTPHPKFGAQFPIGSKADQFSFNTFRVNTLATLQSDPRVQRVVDLQFKAIGDTLYVNSRLLLKDAQDYVATNFELRRF